MLSVTGLNKFYYIKNFTDMRCKYGRVLSVIRRQLGREPEEGDVFVVMSRNRRLVRLFAYDRISCTLFEKRFMSDYEFMRVEYDGEQDGLARSGDASGEPGAQAPASEVKFFRFFETPQGAFSEGLFRASSDPAAGSCAAAKKSGVSPNIKGPQCRLRACE